MKQLIVNKELTEAAYLICNNHLDVNSPELRAGEPLLYSLIRTHNLEAIEFLIECGINLNHFYAGDNVVTYAIKHDFFKAAELFVKEYDLLLDKNQAGIIEGLYFAHTAEKSAIYLHGKKYLNLFASVNESFETMLKFWSVEEFNRYLHGQDYENARNILDQGYFDIYRDEALMKQLIRRTGSLNGYEARVRFLVDLIDITKLSKEIGAVFFGHKSDMPDTYQYLLSKGFSYSPEEPKQANEVISVYSTNLKYNASLSNHENIQQYLKSIPGAQAVPVFTAKEGANLTDKQGILSATYFYDNPAYDFSLEGFIQNYVAPAYISLFHDSREVTEESIAGIVEEIPSHPIINQIFQIQAHECTAGRNFIVLPFADPNAPAMTGGAAFLGEIHKIAGNRFLHAHWFQAMLVHELAHQTVDFVFGNRAKPYGASDALAREAYHQAIEDTLKNLGSYYFGKDYTLFESKQLFAVGRDLYEAMNEDLLKEAKTSWLYPVVSLFENIESLNDKVNFILMDLGRSMKAENNPGFSLNDLKYLDSFLRAFNTGIYNEGSEDCEVIVRLPELIARGASESFLELLAPLKNYYEHYVTPHLEEYIKGFEQSSADVDSTVESVVLSGTGEIVTEEVEVSL